MVKIPAPEAFAQQKIRQKILLTPGLCTDPRRESFPRPGASCWWNIWGHSLSFHSLPSGGSQFLALHPQFGVNAWCEDNNVTMNNVSHYFVVSIEMIENEKFHWSLTDDAWWNFHVRKFHKLSGDLTPIGSLEDHKGFGALHPQFWRARTATVPSPPIFFLCLPLPVPPFPLSFPFRSFPPSRFIPSIPQPFPQTQLRGLGSAVISGVRGRLPAAAKRIYGFQQAPRGSLSVVYVQCKGQCLDL